jgi:Zn2+/Cd2+-exporting ATPase
MGAGGSAMAVVAADVVILSNNLLRLSSAVSLCQSARFTIIVNCVFAITVKLVAIVLAILGMLKLWHAVLIDVGSLLFVVINGSSILFKSYLFVENKSSAGGCHDHCHDHDHDHDGHDHDHDHDHSCGEELVTVGGKYHSVGNLNKV